MPLSRRARIRIALLFLVASAAGYIAVLHVAGTRAHSPPGAQSSRHGAGCASRRSRRAPDGLARAGRSRRCRVAARGPPAASVRARMSRARWRRVGLTPLATGTGLVEPFRFVHTSVKGFFLPGRPFRTAYEDAANVAGRMPGSRAGRQVVVSAHYDHLGVRDGVVYPAPTTTRPAWPRYSQRPARSPCQGSAIPWCSWRSMQRNWGCAARRRS